MATMLTCGDHERDVDASWGGMIMACEASATRARRATGGEEEWQSKSKELFHNGYSVERSGS